MKMISNKIASKIKYRCLIPLCVLLLFAFFFADTDRRIQTLTTIAGPGMLSLVNQSLTSADQNAAAVSKYFSPEVSNTLPSKEAPRIALTFDDGPNSKYTPLLLDGLRERKVHASFFLIGENIEGNEDILQQMRRDGHLIGTPGTMYNLIKYQLRKLAWKLKKQIIVSMKPQVFIPPMCALHLVHGSKIWSCLLPCFLFSGMLIHWTGRARI